MIKYDLILTVVNRGYADEVMKAAKKAGAFGGTVLNARGTGTNELQEFFGALIQPEKDLIMILTEREKRNDIMTAISIDAGLAQKGKDISFSLPVDAVTGISALAEKESDEKITEKNA